MQDVIQKKGIKIERVDARVNNDASPKRNLSDVQRPKKPRRHRLWLVALFATAFFIFALSVLFAKATIIINPRIEEIALNENLSAVKNSSTESPSFDLVIISGEESAKVEAQEEEDVAIRAEGTAILYNTFSAVTQRLSIDTRLEGSNGKIYKTTKELTIPGMKKDGTAGSVEAGIYAAEAGEAYNSGPLDFKIFGFKGTPKYEKLYGRSKGEITGGLSGKVPLVGEELKTKTLTELKNSLQAKLHKKVEDQMPEGFVLFKDAAILSVGAENVNYKDAKDGLVPITLKGTLYGLLLNEKKLTKTLAEDAMENYDGSEVYISNMKDLKFSLHNKEYVNFSEVKNIDFNLSGAAKFVSRFDEEKFIGDILGNSKDNFNAILSKYPGVHSADLSLRPIWKMSLPEKREDVELIVNYP